MLTEIRIPEPRTLDCGCETSPGGRLASLCAMHGEHFRAVSEIAKHPQAESKGRQWELVQLLAPVVLARWGTVTDFDASAQCLFDHVDAIQRRLD